MGFKFKNLIPIIGIILLIYLIAKIGFMNIFNELLEVNLYWFSIAIIFLFISFITQTFKWSIIARFQKIDISFWKAFNINMISGFYGFVTPSRLGNIMRADYLKDCKGGDIGKGVTNFILDKIFDLFSLIFIVVVFSFVFKDIIPINYFYFSFFIFLIFVVGIIIFKNEERSKKMLGIFYLYFVPNKLKDKLKDRFYSFYKDIPSKKYFLIFMTVNLINWIMLYSAAYFIGVSLEMKVPFLVFLVSYSIASLVGQIPITISGIGTREAVLISLLRPFGVGASKAFSISIIGVLLGGIIPSIIAIFLILRMRFKANEKSKYSSSSLE